MDLHLRSICLINQYHIFASAARQSVELRAADSTVLRSRALCSSSEMINRLWAGPGSALIKDLFVECLFPVILFHYT